MDWFASFGVCSTWVSDRGSHFKNKVIDTIRKTLRSQHHFTTANTPWANGTIERVCREVLRAVRALLSEFKLRTTQWTEVHRIVQSVLNNTPSPHRNNIEPVTAFTGLPAGTPLLSISPRPPAEELSITEIRARQLMQMESLRTSMDAVHKQIHDTARSRREQQRNSIRKKRSVHTVNFALGDYVLVAKREFMMGEKLSLRWRGPKRIVGILSDYVFDVEDLRNGKVGPVHAQRLRFYHDASLNVTAELIEHVAHNEQGYEVQALKKIRFDLELKQFMLLVSWLGFEEHDNTWEPLQVLYEDVPEKVKSFLYTCSDKRLAVRALESIALN